MHARALLWASALLLTAACSSESNSNGNSGGSGSAGTAGDASSGGKSGGSGSSGAAGAASSGGTAGSASTGGSAGSGSEEDAQHVMTWIPPWSIEDSKAMLSRSYGNVSVASTLDRIGLQFWTIRADSRVEYLPGPTDEDVRWFVKHAHDEGIRVLVTVTNDGALDYGYDTFHWEVTRRALAGEGTQKVVDGLMKAVNDFGLDGVDLDMEAGGEGTAPYTQADRELFANFVSLLSGELKPNGKLLTVDSFVSDLGAVPKPQWWPDWQGEVDAIHAMGYSDTYARGPGTAGYQVIQDMAIQHGYAPNQLLIGIPLWLDAWAGDQSNTGASHVDNLTYIAHCLQARSGVALWALNDPAMNPIEGTNTLPWASPEPWSLLHDIRTGVPRDSAQCKDPESEESIVDDMSTAGLNVDGGHWTAISNYWSLSAAEQPNASKILTSDESYDMALGEGDWGDIKRGYHDVYQDKIGLGAVVQTFALSGGAASQGGLLMEFLPRDCSQLPPNSNDCGWNAQATVDRDLSAWETLVVGLRCDSGNSLWIALQSRAGAVARLSPFAKEIACTGQFEDYELRFTELRDANGKAGFDSTQSMSLAIDFIDESPPSKVALSVAGVTLDRSTLELRDIR